MASDSKIEIRLITDYREFLLGKIETLKNSVNQVATSFGNDISSSVDEFSKIIYTKLKIIDDRFLKQSDELESLRAELLSKKFDESNFNNVSMIRTLDKTIKERDLKIKELESRIRYLEGNASGVAAAAAVSVASSTKKKIAPTSAAVIEINIEPVPAVPAVPAAVVEPETADAKSQAVMPENIDKLVDAPRVVDADGDVVIAVSAKRSRVKTDKKKAEPVSSAVPDVSSVPEESAVVEEKPKKPIRKIKKASKVEKDEETKVDAVVPESSQDVNDAIEAQRLADEEALRQAAEEAAEAERIEEAQRLAEAEERLALEAEAEAKAKAQAQAEELEKKKKTEIVKKPVIAKKENKDSTKKITSKTSSTTTSATVPATLTTKSSIDAVLPQPAKETPKEPTKVKMDYPDKMPELNDLEVITVSDNDYYCDKKNKAVYQMVNGDDIGVFMGYFDYELETIIPVDT